MADPEGRWIIHVDLDAFFASVEELRDPSLRGKPVVVGGDPERRGVVSSASYAARAYGVRSAMPMTQALRLCPQAMVITPRHDEYARRSQAVMAILSEITPAVEPLSIDEATLDITGCERLWGRPLEIGRLIQRRIATEQGLPASLGIASNRLVAKIACDQGKPQGLVLVERGQERAHLAPLPIERLWGVGRVLSRRLRALGIDTIGDLAVWPLSELRALMGEGAVALQSAARGEDARPVQPGHERRSISQEHTFARDVAEAQPIQQALMAMSEHLGTRLRATRSVAGTVRLKLRFPDFRTITRQVTLEQPTDQGQVIHARARALLEANWRPGTPLRLVGVGVSGLIEGGGYQLGLFDPSDRRRAQLERTLDEIRDRYGRRAIRRASLLDADDD